MKLQNTALHERKWSQTRQSHTDFKTCNLNFPAVNQRQEVQLNYRLSAEKTQTEGKQG